MRYRKKKEDEESSHRPATRIFVRKYRHNSVYLFVMHVCMNKMHLHACLHTVHLQYTELIINKYQVSDTNTAHFRITRN